jgi:hypothetical protein
MRFDVQWKAKGESAGPLELFVELRGSARGDLPKELTLEQDVAPRGWFSHWSSFLVTGDDYLALGEVTAWRVTLWEGDQMLSEQKSFLW